MSRRIFLAPEDYQDLRRHAESRGMTVQEFVDSAVSKLQGVK